MKIEITRTINLPDPARLELFRRNPEIGPKILFFSGGNALRATSAELIYYTHNSIHIITPMDSGGSSAKLRDAFHMPAIGDIRNRLMALADRSLSGNPEIFKLFAYRFPQNETAHELRRILDQMVAGRQRLIVRISDPMRKIIRQFLGEFQKRMPSGFDLRGASVGNLILAGGYLSNRRHLDPVIYIFSKLVNVRGTVRPVTNRNLHLVGELDNAQRVVGQHLLTGKEAAPIAAKVLALYPTEDIHNPAPVDVSIREKVRQLIAEADLICYPMGSFFSSVLANLLPSGVGSAISQNPCPKVFIPNTDTDPELFGYSLSDQVNCLVNFLRKDAPDRIRPHDVLNFMLLDPKNGRYAGEPLPPDTTGEPFRGIHVIPCRLVSMRSMPYIDEKLLVPVLLTLA